MQAIDRKGRFYMTFIMAKINIGHVGEVLQKNEVVTSTFMTNIICNHD